HQLIDDGDHAALVCHAAFDAFGNKLVDVVGGVLEVTVGRAFGHGAQAAHAAVGLVGTALIQHHFAGGFFGTGEHAAHHAGGGPRSERLGDVARITDTAIGNERNARAVKRLGDVGNGGDLGYAHARNDAGGADGTCAGTDLDGVGAGGNQCTSCCGRCEVAPNGPAAAAGV